MISSNRNRVETKKKIIINEFNKQIEKCAWNGLNRVRCDCGRKSSDAVAENQGDAFMLKRKTVKTTPCFEKKETNKQTHQYINYNEQVEHQRASPIATQP